MNSPELPQKNRQREVWVREIIGLTTAIILAATLVIFIGTLAGFLKFADTIPAYVLTGLILPAWWAANHGYWKWAAAVPILLSFGLGVQGSILTGFSTISVLYYALAVILAGMLYTNLAGLLTVVASTLTYAVLGSLHRGFTWDLLAPILAFSFGLLALSLLRWYSQDQLQKALHAQINSNEMLKTEIFFREQAEFNQRQQEAQLRRLAENTTDLVMEIDKTGLIHYASPSHRASLGYEPESLLGVNAYELVHPDDIQAAAEVARLAELSHKPSGFQGRIRRSDGQYLWMEVYGTPLYNQQAELTGFVLSSRDITEQRRAEQAIHESEQKFRRIIEMLPLGVHMYTLTEDGRLVFAGYNPAADRILNVDHAQYLGKTIESVFPGLVEDGVAGRFHRIARTGENWLVGQLPYGTPPINGVFEVNAFQTEPGKMVSVFSDITERIQAAEALHLSEEKFSTAFLTSPDAIAINRLSDGLYIDINQGFTHLMGYTRDDLAGRSSLELSIWADPNDRDRLVKGLLENGLCENLEARFRKKNGEVGIGLMSARIIIIQGERCILSITREISEWIRAQVDLRETHAKLEQAYEATLGGWARALELRERETADHSRRVVEQTVRMAQALGISGDDLLHLQRGALLHDIGKMGVPDEILLKPGRLTTEEWAIMRQHPEYARAMLADIAYLHPSISIPYCHHERWDGSGYPRGLKGEDIPLPARIFAIVDVYDALTHNRPYRPAWSEADARSYLIQEKGKSLDPALVDLFLCLIK